MHHFIDLLPGIVWACFLGLVMGNYATNPIYRLPRNESLFEKDPYCGDCNTRLKPRDLFPVFSWLLTRGKCRYCGAAVPGAYTLTEALTAVFFVICYLKFGFSEKFILVSLGMTAMLMLGMMLTIDNFFSGKTLITALVAGMLYRTLQDTSMYGFAGGAFAALMISGLVWKLSGRTMVRDVAAFPEYMKLLILAGVWLPTGKLCVTFAVALISIAFRKKPGWVTEWSIISAIILLTLFPIQ